MAKTALRPDPAPAPDPVSDLRGRLRLVQEELDKVNLRRFRGDTEVRLGVKQLRADTAELLARLA